MPRNNYTTEGKASNLLRHLLQFRILSGPFRPTDHCAQAVVEHSVEFLSYSCLSKLRWP